MRTRFLLLVILFWRSVLSQKPPKIEVYSPVTVREGMCVTIPCKIRFSPFFWSLTASWFREGADTARDKPVATNRNQDVQEDTQGRFTFRQHPMIQDCSLSITDARKADSGKYFLEVTIGESQKYTYTDLKVYVDVTVLIPGTGSHLLLPEGETLLLVCTVDSNLSAMFNWTWGGRTLKSSLASHFQALPLKLPSLKGIDSGEYSCQVWHPFGTQRASLNLYVQTSIHKNSSWPLIITVLRGVLMATGFLLAYGFIWLYYTRPCTLGRRGQKR